MVQVVTAAATAMVVPVVTAATVVLVGVRVNRVRRAAVRLLWLVAFSMSKVPLV